MTLGRLLMLLFGIVGGLIAVGLLFGGAAVLWVGTGLPDSEGYINTETLTLESDTCAIITEPAEIELPSFWKFNYAPLATLRVVCENMDPSRGVFIGIASAADVTAYLGDAAYDEIIDFSLHPYTLDFRRHAGTATLTAPTEETFWTASVFGTEAQSLTWNVDPGRYALVLMNADASTDLDLETRVGARVPLLRGVGIGLVTGGVIVLFIASLLIYLATRK
jgi:hypothetical protein